MFYTWNYDSPLGGITMASDGERLTGLWFDGQKHYASTLPAEHERRDLPVFRQTASWLDQYFGGERPGPTPPLRLIGSPFRQEVWNMLTRIPYGRVVTYQTIAREYCEKTGKSAMSARAIGGAVSHNPVSLIVPCHRVVGSGGALTGYAGGITIKERLLNIEKVDMSGRLISTL